MTSSTAIVLATIAGVLATPCAVSAQALPPPPASMMDYPHVRDTKLIGDINTAVQQAQSLAVARAQHLRRQQASGTARDIAAGAAEAASDQQRIETAIAAALATSFADARTATVMLLNAARAHDTTAYPDSAGMRKYQAAVDAQTAVATQLLQAPSAFGALAPLLSDTSFPGPCPHAELASLPPHPAAPDVNTLCADWQTDGRRALYTLLTAPAVDPYASLSRPFGVRETPLPPTIAGWLESLKYAEYLKPLGEQARAMLDASAAADAAFQQAYGVPPASPDTPRLQQAYIDRANTMMGAFTSPHSAQRFGQFLAVHAATLSALSATVEDPMRAESLLTGEQQSAIARKAADDRRTNYAPPPPFSWMPNTKPAPQGAAK